MKVGNALALVTVPWRLRCVAALVLAVMGCAGFRVSADDASLRLAVYVGDGARSGGVFRWLELTACARATEVVPVDAATIRAGALDGVDVLVVPGGRSVLMAKSLGEDGRSKVKAFVERGGGYIGTCAGCCLTMEPTKGHPDMLNMIPFTFGQQGGKDRADLLLHFNDRAEVLAGIKKGNRRVWFGRGPVLIPSKPVSNAVVEVVATYASDVNSTGVGPLPSKAGRAAAVAGTYGKGRLFVLGVHPENDVEDHGILRGAFKYVTGRTVEWDLPQRRRGQLAVGVVCDDSFGVESAKFLQRIVRAGEFELVPLSSLVISGGALRHLDAVLVPDCIMGGKPRTGLFGDNLERTREFIGRGGRIFAWGRAAELARRIEPRIELVAGCDAALAALRAFAAEPVPAPAPLPGKAAKPLRAAIYADKGGSNVAVAEMLALAPEYELKVLSAEDYRRGALEGIDLLVQPGGGCHSQYTNLGPDGVAALKRYVTGGGRYYGICAGAFLASQPVPTTKRGPSRVGLVPFKDDTPEHYRGWAPIKMSLTDEGRAALGLSITNSTVMYWGGPAFVAGEVVPDSDVKVWGTYEGRIINTCSSEPVKEMAGKAALVGGRVGKGRVFLTCPHPEKSEANFDIVRGGIKFLTGVAPSPVNHDRVRGAVSVFFRAAKRKSAAEFYLGTLLRDRRFDASAGSSLDADILPHLDAVVIPAPLQGEDDAVSFLGAFIAKGGRVVIVADTENGGQQAASIPGAVVVDAYGKVLDALLRK